MNQENQNQVRSAQADASALRSVGSRTMGRLIVLAIVFVTVVVAIASCFARQLAPLFFDSNYHKFWAHRVNTVEKLALAEGGFLGVELDIVLVQDGQDIVFDVNHPPAFSIGLDLDEYWEGAVSPSTAYWLDIKNLDGSNVTPSLAELRALMDIHGIRVDQLVVESNNARCLKAYSRAGFYTSLYLPYLELDGMSDDEQSKRGHELQAQALAGEVNAISFPGYMYAYVKRHMQREHFDVDLLTWFVHRSVNDFRDWPLLNRVAADPSVKVVLVRFKTDFDR